MVRNLLIMGMIIMALATCALGWWKLTEKKPEQRIQPVVPRMDVPADVTPALIQSLNARNAQIRTLVSNEMKVKVWENGLRFRLTGSLAYEKDRHFRMKINSAFGQEVDLGSNDEVFWYWSRRSTRPGLFYARHEDYSKTRLKTPFNPLFVQASLGLDPIDVRNAQLSETPDNLVVFDQFRNGVGELVNRYTFISKANQYVVGHLITNVNGQPVAISEITEHQGAIPKKILYTWYEEDKILFIDLTDARYNESIDPKEWIVPNFQPQINIGEE